MCPSSSQANVYFMIGNVGAGKSTLANQLSKEFDAHVFIIDEWMNTLFLMDQPNPPSYEWSLERVERIEKQILKETLRMLKRGTDVILEIGFFSKKQRDRVNESLRSEGFIPIYYYLDIDKETRLQRVQIRNTQQTETYKFHVSR